MKDLEPIITLRVEIENDVAALRRIRERIKTSPDALGSLTPEDPVLAATAFEIHNYYGVSENLMRRVAVAFENALDPGEWHKQLLGRMSLNIEGIRPALFDPDLRGRLDEIRKFRHFFRNAYDRRLDPRKVAEVLEVLRTTHDSWTSSTSRFLAWLGELARGMKEA
jgi:hypothetical protein